MSAPATVPTTGAAVVVDDVSRVFRRRSAPFRPASETLALDHVSLTVPRRSRFGVVGESGSGKTTLVRLIAALDRPTSGTVTVDGTDISALPESGLRPLRRRLQLVFQDPMGSLDPRMRIADIVAEPLRAQRASGVLRAQRASGVLRAQRASGVLRAQRTADVDARVREVLAEVGLDAGVLRRYPHQFSGGQRQRISIARAIAPRPSILLADEAVSALDVSSRGQVLDLLDRLAATGDFTLIFVSHDLSVIRRVCDSIAVLQHGRLVETGPTAQVYADPQHPYTRELLAAVPTLERGLAAARRRHPG